MKRGGTFPRWRWLPDRPLSPRLTAFALRVGRCKAIAVEWPQWWCASVMELDEDEGLHYWENLIKPKRFARRCDAKRWCERMMATHPAENGREE